MTNSLVRLRQHSSTPGSARGATARWCRRVAVAVLAAVLVGVPVGSAWADEEGESDQARVLVQQALALLVNGNTVESVREKLDDAVGAPIQEGVDMAVVERVRPSLDQPSAVSGESDRERIASQLQPALLPAVTVTMATGADTGTTVVLPELKPARGVTDPGDAGLLGSAALAIGVGVTLAYRWRPAVTVASLRRAEREEAVTPEEGVRP